jgi:4,5-DOPA dioxygenase extradiol
MSATLPALFVGHGNPMNAIRVNAWTRAWSELGAQLPRPRAVLSVSAHWYVPGLAATAMPQPRTIHDFGGFPRELYAVGYPARGDTALARRVQELLAPLPLDLDQSWGLDHGTWSVLCHMYPQADVPVVQLSIDARQSPQFHYELGVRLRPLRDEGVLILGSGDVVHNLALYSWGEREQPPFAWAVRFEALLRARVSSAERASLIDYEALGKDAQLSAPTPEHYLPLLYPMGASVLDEPVSFPVEGFDGGSISMLAVQFG